MPTYSTPLAAAHPPASPPSRLLRRRWDQVSNSRGSHRSACAPVRPSAEPVTDTGADRSEQNGTNKSDARCRNPYVTAENLPLRRPSTAPIMRSERFSAPDCRGRRTCNRCLACGASVESALTLPASRKSQLSPTAFSRAGLRNRRIPAEHGFELFDLLRAAGKPAELVEYRCSRQNLSDGKTHELIGGRIDDFLAKGLLTGP